MKKTILLLSCCTVFLGQGVMASVGDLPHPHEPDALSVTQGALVTPQTHPSQERAYTFTQMEPPHPELPEVVRYTICSQRHHRNIGLFEIGPAQVQDENYRGIEWALDKGVHSDTVLPEIISFAFSTSASFHTLVFLLSPISGAEMAPFQALDPALNPETRSFSREDGGLSGDFFKARSIGLYSYNVNLPLQKGKISRYLIAYTLSREDAARMEEARLATLPQKED